MMVRETLFVIDLLILYKALEDTFMAVVHKDHDDTIYVTAIISAHIRK